MTIGDTTDDSPLAELPTVEEPLLSVVMVTFGAQEWVSKAIEALVANTAPVYELVVVDNASPDSTVEWLAQNVRPLTLVRNDRNVGFGPGANQGALAARGPFLFFLNSDAMVEPGWLEPILETFDAVPRAGAVAPMFLNLDGTLQEAGSIVGREGGTPIGYGDDPELPQYRFRRFVAYGSGAALVLRRSTFLALGGFDPRYGLGYSEDVDLCFDIAAHGLRVVYEPRSRIRHALGASSPPDNVIKLRDANAKVFRDRWEGALNRFPSLVVVSSYPHRLVALRDADALDRLLLVTDVLPSDPAAPFAELASAIVALCPRARVTVMGLDQVDAAEHLLPLSDRGVELVWGVTDWDGWLSTRLLHYSGVIVYGCSAGARAETIFATQPQAQRVYYAEPDATTGKPDVHPDDLSWADALWYQSEFAREEFRSADPFVPRFMVGPSEEASEESRHGLRAALVALGMAPEESYLAP